MTNAFDPRIVRVGIQIEKDFLSFEGLDIRVQGQKTASPTQNLCNIKISNLTRDIRNYILTKARPYPTVDHPNLTPAFITVDVGRRSYTPFRLFEGFCYTSTVTQPPDIGIILTSTVDSILAGAIINMSLGSITTLKAICQEVAKLNNKKLVFGATDRQIANFSFTGKAGKLIEKIQLFGAVRCFVDNDSLIVIDANSYRNSPKKFELNMDNGMVGLPQATQNGVTAMMLVVPDINIGDNVALTSKINPSVNGSNYFLSSMTFDIANRDTPFYYTLNLTNQKLVTGTA